MLFVARSSGNEALDGAAVEAVYNWNFSPAKDTYGSPVRCYITIAGQFCTALGFVWSGEFEKGWN